MRLVKFKKCGGGGTLFIAPAAVTALEERPLDCPGNVMIYVAENSFCVEENIETVMNKLYYKNDGGHQFGEYKPEPTPTPTEGKSV
jgi:hypothetical protein